MFPILSGVAAFIVTLIAAGYSVIAGQYLAAAAMLSGGLCTFALLKTLSDILDTLVDIRTTASK